MTWLRLSVQRLWLRAQGVPEAELLRADPPELIWPRCRYVLTPALEWQRPGPEWQCVKPRWHHLIPGYRAHA